MKKVIIIISALFIPYCTGMYGGTHKGVVYNTLNKQPIKNATVTVTVSAYAPSIGHGGGTDIHTAEVMTDSNGKYSTSIWFSYPKGLFMFRDVRADASKEGFKYSTYNDFWKSERHLLIPVDQTLIEEMKVERWRLEGYSSRPAIQRYIAYAKAYSEFKSKVSEPAHKKILGQFCEEAISAYYEANKTINNNEQEYKESLEKYPFDKIYLCADQRD